LRLLSLCSLTVAALALTACGDTPPDVVINEFVADNATGEVDEAGEFADWIELHNLGTSTVSLAGLSISDDAADPLKHSFTGDVEIGPSGYLILWADEDITEGSNHLRFRLSKDGEGLYLSWQNSDGGIDAIDSVEYGPQEPDTSSARTPDGDGDWVDGSVPTPGASNG